MKKALVTGGAGFIGSHLARRLLSEGWKVYIADNLSTGFRENVPSGTEFSLLDLSREHFVSGLPVEPVDAVFHLAAQSSGEISFDDPAYDLKTNCLSTVLLLNWCVKKGVKRFIYTSSMSVYGEQDIQPVREGAELKPRSFYGIGKLASERYLDVYSKMGVDTTVLRLFNVYGPGQNMENMRQGMVSIYMAYIMKKKPVLVKGSPDRYRDFVYIDDVINAYVACINHKRTIGGVYNIASGKKTSVRELIDAEMRAFGCGSGYPVEYGKPTPGDTFGIYADISAAVKDLGWKPEVSLQEGLERMRDWVLARKGI